MTVTTRQKRFYWARTLACTGITTAVMALASQAYGQASTCNPAGPTITITPAATTFAIGQKPRINVQFGTSDIEGGTQATIDTLQVSLDCASGTNPCSTCNDEGETIRYSGDSSIIFGNCGGITSANVSSNVPAGGSATNVIVFTFNPPIVLAQNQTCNLSFEVEVLTVGQDNLPKAINGFARFTGECDNAAQFLNGCATYSYPITNPGIQVVKNVSDDLVCEGEPVTYSYEVSIPSPFNSVLCNIVLVDDNATPANNADDFNPTFTGGDTNGNNCLDVGETWTYSHGPVVLPLGTHINTAVVSGEYTNGAGTVTKTDSDDAEVEVKAPPSVEIVGESICANKVDGQICAIITGGRGPYTVCWYSASGELIADSCEVVSVSGGQSCLTVDDEDVYCAVATDNNGCISGEPGDDCGSIDINPNPMVKVTADSVCEGVCGDITATVGGGTAPYSVQWFNSLDQPVGAPCTGLLDNEQCVLEDVCDDGTYTAVVTDAEGCTGEDSGALSFDTPPTCSISTTPGECETTYCVVTNACTPFTVVWSGPGDFESTETCITLGANDAGGVYSVIVTDCNGCVSEGPCQINFVPPVPPSCSIEVSDPDDCEITYCVVTDACTPFDVVWEGPNGYSNTGTCITLGQSNSGGLYTATITDCNGCVSSCNVNFTPPVSPTCDIIVADCPFPRLLTVNPANCTDCTYEWRAGSCGTGGEILSTDATYNAPAAGTYHVSIRSSNGCEGCCEVTVEECQTGGQGRTPGFWKQQHHFGHWPAPWCPKTGCTCGTATLFCEVFDCDNACAAAKAAFEGKTLLQVLQQGGGGFKAMGRHAVAALLNSGHIQVDYLFTTEQVINMVNQAMASCTPGPTHSQFANENELGGGSLGGQMGCYQVVAGTASAQLDLTGDGRVDGDDLLIVLANWGNPPVGDLNNDNKVNNKDLTIMNYWIAALQ